jgi:hypothetical protein
VEIRVFREEEGKRTDTGGVVVSGTAVGVGVKAGGLQVREVRIRGEALALRADPLKQTRPGDPLAMDVVLTEPWEPGSAGSYTVEATAIDPTTLASVTRQVVVQVVSESGGGGETVPGRPGVIGSKTVPREGAKGVSVGAFVSVSFTEPVVGVSSQAVRLLPTACASAEECLAWAATCGDSCEVPLRMIGHVAGASGQTVVIEDGASHPAVSGLTLQPLVSLSWSKAYTVVLTEGIEDRDDPPSKLVAHASGFTTFRPEDLEVEEEEDAASAAGFVVVGDRGYVLETLYSGGVAGPNQAGQLRVYALEDPTSPRELTGPGGLTRPYIAYPPRDVAGEEVKAADGTLSGEKLLAVVAAPRTYYEAQGVEGSSWRELKSTPGNVFLYDVSEPDREPVWVGAGNLTSSIVDGVPSRMAMKDGVLYVSTYGKGIQTVEVATLRQGFPGDGSAPTGTDLVSINRQLYAGGLNTAAVVLTVPVVDPPVTGRNAVPVNDLDVGDLVVWGEARRVVASTGARATAGLVLTDGRRAYTGGAQGGGGPGTGQPQPLWQGAVTSASGGLDWGGAIALGRVNDRPLALVGGTGTLAGAGSQTLLAVVDLTPLAAAPPASGSGQPLPSPRVLALVNLTAHGLQGVGDIVITGTTAIVSGGAGTRIDGRPGGAALVDLTDPERAEVTGTIAGVGSRMALDANGLLLSTDRTLISGVDTGVDGVKTAALGAVAIVEGTDPRVVVVGEGPRAAESFKVKYRVVPAAYEVASSRIEWRVDQATHSTIVPAPLQDGRGYVELRSGFSIPTVGGVMARPRLVLNDGLVDELISAPRALRTEAAEIAYLWDDEAVLTADAPQMDAQLLSQEWFKRARAATQDRPTESRTVSFRALGALTTLTPGMVRADDGVFQTFVETAPQAVGPHGVEARLDDVVLGRTPTVLLEPGEPAEARIEASRVRLPADGASLTRLTLSLKD